MVRSRDSFVVWGTLHGEPISVSLTPPAFAAFRRALKLGFIVADRTARGAGLAWWLWCEMKARPVVEVQLRARHRVADLYVDLLTIDGEFSAQARDAIRREFERIGARKWFSGPEVAYCTVPADIALPLASFLLDTANASRAETFGIRNHRR